MTPPKFEVAKQDQSISKYNGFTPCINAFQSLYSPIQFFCRMRDKGIDMRKAAKVAKAYNEFFYDDVLRKMKREAKYNAGRKHYTKHYR